MPKWKAPRKDRVQGYWLKNLTSLQSHIAVLLNHILDVERSLPDWVAFGKTVLRQKDPAKGSAVNNYRPISYLPLMWKLMNGMLAEKIYSLKRYIVTQKERMYYHLNKKDAVKGVVEQKTNCSLIKQY